MSPNNRNTIIMQEAIIARIREELEAKGNPPIEIPLRVHRHLVTEQFKFGAKKKKASNSGGTGRAGRRNKRPRVPSGIR